MTRIQQGCLCLLAGTWFLLMTGGIKLLVMTLPLMLVVLPAWLVLSAPSIAVVGDGVITPVILGIVGATYVGVVGYMVRRHEAESANDMLDGPF